MFDTSDIFSDMLTDQLEPDFDKTRAHLQQDFSSFASMAALMFSLEARYPNASERKQQMEQLISVWEKRQIQQIDDLVEQYNNMEDTGSNRFLKVFSGLNDESLKETREQHLEAIAKYKQEVLLEIFSDLLKGE